MILEVGKDYVVNRGCDYAREFTFTVVKLTEKRVTIHWSAKWEKRPFVEYTTDIEKVLKSYGKLDRISSLEKAMK